MFSHLKGFFEENVPDDTLAIFLSEGGELAECKSANAHFCHPTSTLPNGLIWWYISDCYHCGKLLEERHYRPELCAALGGDTIELPQSMSIDMSSAPEIIVLSAPETIKDHESDITFTKGESPSFYFCPDDEESTNLKEKLATMGYLIHSELPSINNTLHTVLVIISKYQKYPQYARVHSPFYLARMLDQSPSTTHLHFGLSDDLLDRPCPTAAVQPKQLISFSGFKSGEERTRLQVMITLMGSRYSDYLTPATNCLILKDATCPNTSKSQKAQAARNWSIPILSKQWLLQSFQEWKWASGN